MIVAFVPHRAKPNNEQHRAWSSPLRLHGSTLNLRISAEIGSPTRLEIRHGKMLRVSAQDSVFYDESVRPYLWVRRGTALLAYAADPGAGSGIYASVWKIADEGRALKQIGLLRYADLRLWRKRGVVRELRPAKYATKDLARALPDVFDTRYTNKRFIVDYRFDRQTARFRFVGYHIVSRTFPWPKTVRFPSK